jgi:hypothetical protein
MKCDSRASLLARTFASPCLGHKPKARVVTQKKLTSNDAPNYNKYNGKNQTCSKQKPRSSIPKLLIRKHTIKIKKQFHVA